MKIRSLAKLPKRKITPEEILGADDITDCLKDLYDKRYDIDQFILIYTDKASVPHVYWQGTKERIVYALENAKFEILKGDYDTESTP